MSTGDDWRLDRSGERHGRNGSKRIEMDVIAPEEHPLQAHRVGLADWNRPKTLVSVAPDGRVLGSARLVENKRTGGASVEAGGIPSLPKHSIGLTVQKKSTKLIYSTMENDVPPKYPHGFSTMFLYKAHVHQRLKTTGSCGLRDLHRSRRVFGSRAELERLSDLIGPCSESCMGWTTLGLFNLSWKHQNRLVRWPFKALYADSQDCL